MTKYTDIELLRRLCLLFGPSGCEDNVADFIKVQIDDVCDSLYTDRLGSLIAHIGSGKPDRQRLMISAHMDEVGFMINEICDDGYLKFETLGGIDPSVLCGKNVTLGDEVNKLKGVIASKAIHHKKRDERLNVTPVSDMYIDIGLSSKEDVLKYLDIGAYGTFDSEFIRFGKDGRKIKAKALDDRLGCAVMIEAMRDLYPKRDSLPMDIYFCFTVREEIGISGAQVAANVIKPDFAIVLETTAVADIAGASDSSKVAVQGDGGAISLMDRSTIYDREFVDFALDVANKNAIKAQIKKYVSGGNDASHIHKSGVGVRTLALSAPTRYLHSPACVVDTEDYYSILSLVGAMLREWKFAD
ncbi:MAG: M20/M25/M40 family metallo-hydrolase [Clostridia bacterium]|nr:M20/M25/M40 family metallo-hydrolase [Clostridia bacterium]